MKPEDRIVVNIGVSTRQAREDLRRFQQDMDRLIRRQWAKNVAQREVEARALVLHSLPCWMPEKWKLAAVERPWLIGAYYRIRPKRRPVMRYVR